MNIDTTLHSRRDFLRKMSYGAALAAAASYSPYLIARATGQAAIRHNAEMLPLHFNENSLGMSVKAANAAQQALLKFGNRYAMEDFDSFLSKLANHHKVDETQLIFGNGSTEVLSAVVTFAASQGAVVIEPSPTFGALRDYSKNHGMQVISVPVDKDFVIDLSIMRETAQKQSAPVLINLCNPNNPTGNIVKHAYLVDWIANAPENHLFLIDEAYYDYAAGIDDYQSMLPMIKAGKDNVVVTRTFSKIYGMAGMRMGYGLATPKTAAKIKPFSADANLNVAGIAAASASLDDTEYYEKSLSSTRESKAILIQALDELSLAYVPSHTNFILHRINQPLASYAGRMLENNVKVGRKMTESEYWNRISLGTPEQMQQFVATLKAFRARDWV